MLFGALILYITDSTMCFIYKLWTSLFLPQTQINTEIKIIPRIDSYLNYESGILENFFPQEK